MVDTQPNSQTPAGNPAPNSATPNNPESQARHGAHFSTNTPVASSTDDKLAALDQAEQAIERAYATGKADRAAITQAAQADATEAVRIVGLAMDADEEADEAARIAVIANESGNRDNAKQARTKMREARKKARSQHKAATKSAKRAYQAVKFSSPDKLGFMRVVQVFFALHVVGTLVALILTSRDTIVYSSLNIIDWVMVVLEGVALWFFLNRYKVGRPFVIVISIIGIAAQTINEVMETGTFSLSTMVFQNFFYLFLMCYFIFSKRVKAVLVNNFAKDKGYYTKDELSIERKGWPLVRNLVMYFVVFSVLGHWMEAAMCQLIRLGLVQGEYDPSNTMLWRDWLYPYPMEGLAVVLIALLLYPLFIWLKKKFNNRIVPYVLSFLANMLTCTLIELVGGLIFNAELQNWDYSDHFGNFMGQICLQNALAFGAAASIIAWYVYPLLERWLARLPEAGLNIAFVVIAIAGGILFSLYAISPPEGIDLGQMQSQEQQATAESQREELSTLVEVLGGGPDAIQESLDNQDLISSDERAQIEEQLNKIKEDYQQLNDLLQSNAQSGVAVTSQAG